MMIKELGPGFRITLIFTVILGVIYPVAMTGISSLVFPAQANGSMVSAGGRVVGSSLIGQAFTRPEYFHPRPSGNGYDATASGASNLGPNSKKLIDRVRQSVADFRRENPDFQGDVPADIVTASASGLDPHISQAAAEAQAPRVAKARGASIQQVQQWIMRSMESADFGFLGEPHVNVLLLNIALDERLPVSK